LFADHQADGHKPLVVCGPQVENHWIRLLTNGSEVARGHGLR